MRDRWQFFRKNQTRIGAAAQLRAKRALVALLFTAILSSLGFGPPVITESRPGGLRLYPEHIRAAYDLKQVPQIRAQAALALDLDSDKVLYARRINEPLPPASTAKLMTALVTVRRADLTARVTVSPLAAQTSGSRMGLVSGETLTVSDLLYGLLLPSGNDAAVALAEHVAGSQDAFVSLMNETAAELQLKGTHFTNPHGLDDPAQTSSAADLAFLAKAALAHPLLAKIVALPKAQVAGRNLANTNELLGTYRGADGVKTGTTDAAGECLVASVTRDGHRLLVVILGSTDRYADVRTVLNFAVTGWRWQSVQLPDNALAWTLGADGHAYRLRTAMPSELFLPAWQWSLIQPARILDPVVPLTSTLPVGTLTVVFAGQSLATVPLITWQGP